MTRRLASAALAAAVLASASHVRSFGAANGLRAAAPAEDFAIESSIAEAAMRFGLSADWIRAVIRAESGGDAFALSRAGAVGLMQLMPSTYADLRSRYGLGANPYTVRDNILAGSAYLRELHDRYGPVGMLAAYNAGPRRWEEHLRTGRSLPEETVRYLSKLGSAVGIPLIDVGLVAGPAATERQPSDTLFAVRGDPHAAAREFAEGRISAGEPALQARGDGPPSLFVMVAPPAPRPQDDAPGSAGSLTPPIPAARSAPRAGRLSGAPSPALSGGVFVPRDKRQPAS